MQSACGGDVPSGVLKLYQACSGRKLNHLLLQPLGFFPDEFRKAVFGIIHERHSHVERLGHLFRRPTLYRVAIEHLELFIINLLFHPLDCSLKDVVLPFLIINPLDLVAGRVWDPPKSAGAGGAVLSMVGQAAQWLAAGTSLEITS